MYLKKNVKADEIAAIVPMDASLFEVDKEKSERNHDIIVDCVKIVVSLNNIIFNDLDNFNMDLLQILIMVYGYQDDDRINTIHSILTSRYEKINKGMTFKKFYLNLFKQLHDEIEKELLKTISVDEHEIKMVKGNFFIEDLNNQET